MKKVFFLFCIIIFILSIFSFRHIRNKVLTAFFDSPAIVTKTSDTIVPRKSGSIMHETTSLFVPYWTRNISIGDEYDTVLYFGITPNDTGVNTAEAGYKQLSSFIKQTQGKRRYLVLRMTDSQQNFRVIENDAVVKRVIDEAIRTAADNKFDGIVLNLEVSALPFESVIKNITQFTESFYANAKSHNLHFAITIYGDTFYRIRPFDMKELAEITDEVMVMAYDFSKANGNPGPNFPLRGKEKYGYDFETMIGQFLESVPVEKMTVIFGMYGYDWAVGADGKTITSGVSRTYNQISQSFLPTCVKKDCVVIRDSLSQETKISYTSDDGKHHILWFEDEDSVAKKKEFLKTQGIGSTSYWAYSYF